MDSIESLKKKAAEKAVEFIKSDMVIGLGTGSTAAFALQRIAELLKSGELKNILGIPSSVQTAKEALKLGIPLTTFDDHPTIDITIDGADEVDPQLNLIKGGGGALLREKILAQFSKRVIIIVDESKLSPVLGSQHPLPVEVLPFAWRPEALYLESLGAKITLRQQADGNVYHTDQDNFILDCQFGEIKEPETLAAKLQQRAGIMAHGLFLGMASEVIVAGEKGIRHLTR